MHIVGKLDGAIITIDGQMLVTFATASDARVIDEINEIKNLDALTIDAVKYKEKKSTQANAYMWQLLDKIAKHPEVNADKWDVYISHIKLDGVFVDVKVREDAYKGLQRLYRYTEVLDTNECFDMYGNPYTELDVRCYYGSSTYTKDEMHTLVSSVVETARAYGIDTWTDDEVREVTSIWEGVKADGRKY